MTIQAIWIRNDLRLQDNTALIAGLSAARAHGHRLMLFFHINSEQLRPGTRGHDYFFSALSVFLREAAVKGIPIFMLYGDIREAFEALIREFPSIKAVHFNRCEAGAGVERDAVVTAFLEERGIQAQSYLDAHLLGAHEVKTGQGAFYKVFTPYFRKWHQIPKRPPMSLNVQWLQAVTLPSFGDRDRSARHQLDTILSERRTAYDSECGETIARERLKAFCVHHIDGYAQLRDYPSVDGTSRLSPHLRTGEISVRAVLEAALGNVPSEGRSIFIKELAWRDFYHMMDAAHPNQQNEELIPKYRRIHWRHHSEDFDKWRLGMTGFPIVDAAMRQLKETGWMHNRLRMIVASFLVKDLLMDWRWGERYFSEALIDYDRASNVGGWQWAASVGTDACPYFRVFNPTRQSEKFDAEGLFIKKYVPELRPVPTAYIHAPHKMPAGRQRALGISIGETYPAPIADHAVRRLEAIELFNL